MSGPTSTARRTSSSASQVYVVVRGSGRMKLDDEIVEDVEGQRDRQAD